MGFAPLLAISAGVNTLNKNAAADAQNAVYDANALSAGNAANLKGIALKENTFRQEQDLAGKEADIQLAALRGEAQVAASASESGVGGQSVTNLMIDQQNTALTGMTAIQRQME